MVAETAVSVAATTAAPTGRERFLAKLAPFMLEDDLDHVHTAYVFAKYGHRDQMRDDGTRYFEHPRSVAEILIDELGIRNDWRLIAVALMHDLIEDSWLLNERRLVKNFGKTVAEWIKFLTKKPKEGYLDRIIQFAPWQVLLLKLADRLQNLRTLGGCPPAKQRKQIVETRERYVPLADLLIARLPKRHRAWGEHLKREIVSICATHPE